MEPFILIQHSKSGEYVYAEVDELAKDPDHRRVFTRANSTTHPVSPDEFWGKTPHWRVAEETNSSYLFTLKNGRYDEFLDADSEAYNQPGEVFTKKKKLTLSAKKATGLSLQT